MRWVAEEGGRLDHFLVAKLSGASRSRVSQLIDSGGVLVNGVAPNKAGMQLRAGWTVEAAELVETEPQRLEPVPMDLAVPYEDGDLLIIDKPRGLSVHPGAGRPVATLVHGLLARGHGLSEGSEPFRPGIVHRLDKETTGLMVVAKNDKAHSGLSAQIKQHSVVRRYLVRTRQTPALDRFTIDAPVGRDPAFPLRMKVVAKGRRAVTHVRNLRRMDRGALLLCQLETGRTHQIRVHLAHYGYEVLGDPLYGLPPFTTGPLQLHSSYISFVHPRTGEQVSAFSRPPADFDGCDTVSEAEVVHWI